MTARMARVAVPRGWGTRIALQYAWALGMLAHELPTNELSWLNNTRSCFCSMADMLQKNRGDSLAPSLRGSQARALIARYSSRGDRSVANMGSAWRLGAAASPDEAAISSAGDVDSEGCGRTRMLANVALVVT